ncbi:MAG: hypothetical protein AVDCRST_MAG03-1524, partial [uncultured Rubrobacteraceae bacterium]
ESIGPARGARGPVRGGPDQPDGGGPAGARRAGARRHLGPRHEPDGPHRRPHPREARLHRPGRRLRRWLRGARRRDRRRHSDGCGPGRRRPSPLPGHRLPARLRPSPRRPRRLRRQPGCRGPEGPRGGAHHRRRRACSEVL